MRTPPKSFEEKQARVQTFNRIVRRHINRGIVDIAKLEAVCINGFIPISPFELRLTLRRLESLGEITIGEE
jgi:hypothetical protein